MSSYQRSSDDPEGERHHCYHIQGKRVGKLSLSDKDINDGDWERSTSPAAASSQNHNHLLEKATFKGWVIPQRNSKHLASKFNFIRLAHLLQKPFLGKLLLRQRPYKSKTSWSPSVKITEPHFRYSKVNSCHSIETEESKAWFSAVVLIWYS